MHFNHTSPQASISYHLLSPSRVCALNRCRLQFHTCIAFSSLALNSFLSPKYPFFFFFFFSSSSPSPFLLSKHVCIIITVFFCIFHPS